MNNNITGHTILTGLLGSPVSHSISPLMHNEAFKQLGLDYVYLCFDVGTDTLADKLSPAASMIGAVNTVVNDKGILTGHNTDGIGYMMAVKDAGYDIIGKNMTLMGAGGAATAVCVQAALDGVASINVFSLKDKYGSSKRNIAFRYNKRKDFL